MGSLIILIGVVLSVAIMTLSERKVMGAIQRRVGPTTVGYGG
jgi:NADH:ubiquinone oxidoreductase subunit H